MHCQSKGGGGLLQWVKANTLPCPTLVTRVSESLTMCLLRASSGATQKTQTSWEYRRFGPKTKRKHYVLTTSRNIIIGERQGMLVRIVTLKPSLCIKSGSSDDKVSFHGATVFPHPHPIHILKLFFGLSTFHYSPEFDELPDFLFRELLPLIYNNQPLSCFRANHQSVLSIAFLLLPLAWVSDIQARTMVNSCILPGANWIKSWKATYKGTARNRYAGQGEKQPQANIEQKPSLTISAAAIPHRIWPGERSAQWKWSTLPEKSKDPSISRPMVN